MLVLLLVFLSYPLIPSLTQFPTGFCRKNKITTTLHRKNKVHSIWLLKR